MQSFLAGVPTILLGKRDGRGMLLEVRTDPLTALLALPWKVVDRSVLQPNQQGSTDACGSAGGTS